MRPPVRKARPEARQKKASQIKKIQVLENFFQVICKSFGPTVNLHCCGKFIQKYFFTIKR
jgi:hypothetical protein